MSDFFISHAKKDGRAFALELHDQLEGDGFPAWFDERDIEPGANWPRSIETAVRNCIALLFVLTPGSIASQTCMDELDLAINLGKPILPLKIVPRIDDATPAPPVANTDIPLRLQQRQYIDFTVLFDQGIARLRQQLHQIRRVQTEIATLAQQKTDLQAMRDSAPTPANVDVRMNELDEQIKSRQRILTEPEQVRRENQRAIDVGIESELQGRARAEEQARGLNRQRVVGGAPLGVSDIFKDRVNEAAQITNWLLHDGSIRAVSIVGRGGAGKTALACKVLHELEKDFKNVYGILYMTAATRSRDLSLERIFLGCAKMMGGDVEKRLDGAWTNTNLSLEAKIALLLDQFADKRCLLLFDNLEDILDASGKVEDADLQIFIDAFLRRDHAACLLITSREPLNPADDARRHERTQPLNEGLPEDYAVELLREFDTDGTLGLRDAEVKLLKQAADKTLGFPRALEAIAGILANDPALSLEILLNDRRLFGTEVIEELVSRALSRLDDDALKVMQALALFGRPVPESAVRYLLQPYSEVNGLDISGVVRRLARGRYITLNRSTGNITLHPLDKDYSYKQIPEDPPTNGRAMFIILTRTNLETRAADYYEQLRGDPANWKTIDDLAPILAEFEHRVRAGDFVSAYYLVNTIDDDYLRTWGHSRKEVEMRELLKDKLDDERLEMDNLNRLGNAYNNLGNYQQALEYYLTSLDYWRETGERADEGVTLRNIGMIYGNLGDYEESIRYEEPALEIARETENRSLESSILMDTAVNYDELGQIQQALELYKASLKIDQEIENPRGVSVALGNLGSTHHRIGELQTALDYFDQASAICRKIGYKPNLGWHIGQVGDIYQSTGDFVKALENFQDALRIAQEVGDRYSEIDNLVSIAYVTMAKDNPAASLQYLEKALPIAQEIARPSSLNAVYNCMADAYFLSGSMTQALQANTSALQYVRDSDRHGDAMLRGQILTRLAFAEPAKPDHLVQAVAAYNETLAGIEKLLNDTPNLWFPKYARGIALAGLALCAQMGAPSLQAPQDYIEQAITAYRAARINCDAAGIVADKRRYLDALAVADANGILAPVRAVLA